MRCNPLRWLLGGILVVGLLGIMNLQGVLAQIETDLEQEARQALEQAGLGWAEVGFSGRDSRLSGKAPDENERNKAYQITRSVWGVREVRNSTELIEEEKNYVWRALLRDDKLRLMGFVPNEATRKAIVGAAKATFPQLEIDDRMKLARGAPETEVWLGAVSFGLKQLSALKAGARVEIDSDGLAVKGEAKDFAAFRGVKSALASGLPQGVALKSDGVAPPVVKPYIWAARLSGAQLQLGGFLPSDQAREEVFAAAQKAFADRVIVDRMRIASGEPDDVVPAAIAALEKLAQLEEGEIELKDQELLLSGLAAKEETAETLRKTLRAGVPLSIKVAEEIKFREPTIKPVSPYTLAAAIENEQLLLSGYVPGEPARAALVSAAGPRFPNLKIADRLQLGAGAPEGWQTCILAGFAGLAKLGNGRIDMEDRTLRFAAVTDDEQVAEAIRNELRAAANRACEIDFKIVVNIPPEPELNWRAVRADGEILLEGQVPDEATKSELALAAANLFPDARLIDRMEITAAYSKKWAKVSETGLKLLAKLRNGEVRVAGLELVVSGQAPDTAVATVVRQQLRDLPKGYKGTHAIEVRSDAMIWAEQEAKRRAEAEARRKIDEGIARQKAEEERLRAEEEARKAEEARRKREEESRRNAEQERIREAAAAAAEEAAKRAEAEALAAEEARRVKEAMLRAAPAPVQPAPPVQKAEQSSQPPQPVDAAEPEQKQAAPQPGEQKHAALADPTSAADKQCQQAISTATLHGTINFERASAVIARSDFDTLLKVVEVANACPHVRIEIEGHADAEGSPDGNQVLSERRAGAAVDYLVSHGLPVEKIKSVGYGATRPLAPNDTPDSRALNRRVEIIIRDH